MFFPLLRLKRFEALAIRATAVDLVQSGNVLPIVEPTKREWRNLLAALNNGLTVGIIVNPSFGNYSPPAPRARRAQQAFPPEASAALAHINAIPAYVIGDRTTAAQVRSFAVTHPNRKMFIVNAAPRAVVQSPLAAALALNPLYYVVRRNAVPPSVNRAANVDLVDNFTRRPNNSQYPFDEFYTDRHNSVRTDPDYAHFGDYSIVGDVYSEGGGPANNVALHHVYVAGPNPSSLRIRHYVSAASPSVNTMWYDALTQLVTDLPNLRRLSPLNDTSILADYRALHASRAFPGLGKMKELAIRHHLLLMTVV